MTLAVPFLIMLLVFVGVVIHRGVAARIRIDDAAHQAARAASIERTTAAATTAAGTTAQNALAEAGVACASLTVDIASGRVRPGVMVSVTVSCTVDYGDALILGVPGSTTLSASVAEPVDQFRSSADVGGTP